MRVKGPHSSGHSTASASEDAGRRDTAVKNCWSCSVRSALDGSGDGVVGRTEMRKHLLPGGEEELRYICKVRVSFQPAAAVACLSCCLWVLNLLQHNTDLTRRTTAMMELNNDPVLKVKFNLYVGGMWRYLTKHFKYYVVKVGFANNFFYSPRPHRRSLPSHRSEKQFFFTSDTASHRICYVVTLPACLANRFSFHFYLHPIIWFLLLSLPRQVTWDGRIVAGLVCLHVSLSSQAMHHIASHQ